MIPIKATPFEDLPNHLMLHIGEKRTALVGPGDTIWVDADDVIAHPTPEQIMFRYHNDPIFHAMVDVVIQVKIIGRV